MDIRASEDSAEEPQRDALGETLYSSHLEESIGRGHRSQRIWIKKRMT